MCIYDGLFNSLLASTWKVTLFEFQTLKHVLESVVGVLGNLYPLIYLHC